jgi:hypothetical protein
MTTLSVDTPRAYQLGDMNDLGVVASDIIYEGAAVGDNGSGYARPLVAGDPFWGFALEYVDNSAGSAGDKKVHVRTRGRVQLAVSSAAITDIGNAIYASDDATFTLTASTNTHIGRMVGYVSSGVAIVEFDANKAGIGTLAALTGTTGGTANGAMQDTSTAVTGVDGMGSNAASKADVDTRLGTIANNIEELTAKVNALIARIL